MSYLTDLDAMINGRLGELGMQPLRVPDRKAAPSTTATPTTEPRGDYSLDFKFTLPPAGSTGTPSISRGNFTGGPVEDEDAHMPSIIRGLKGIGSGIAKTAGELKDFDNPLPGIAKIAGGVGESIGSAGSYTLEPLAGILAGAGYVEQQDKSLSTIDRILGGYKEMFTSNPLDTFNQARQYTRNNIAEQPGLLGDVMTMGLNPLTYLTAGGATGLQAAKNVAAPAFGALFGSKAAEWGAHKAGIPDEYDPLAGLVGGALGGGAGMKAVRRVEPAASTDNYGANATPKLLSDAPPGPVPLSRADKLYNSIVNHVRGPLYKRDEYVSPIMKYDDLARQEGKSQAQLVGQKTLEIVNRKDPLTGKKAFEQDSNGRLTGLPGMPTLQDVAAKLPLYEKLLTAPQKAILNALKETIEPWADLMREHGIEFGTREDIMPGGFYLPRQRTILESDSGLKAGGGRGGGSSATKHASFNTMVEGIEAGHKYLPIDEAFHNFVKQSADDVIDSRVASYFKSLTDEDGNPIAMTAAKRVAPELRAKMDGLRKGIRNLTGQVNSAARNAGIADARLNELGNPFEKLNTIMDRATARAVLDDATAALDAARRDALTASYAKGKTTAFDQAAQEAARQARDRLDTARRKVAKEKGFGEIRDETIGVRLPPLDAEAIRDAVDAALAHTKKMLDDTRARTKAGRTSQDRADALKAYNAAMRTLEVAKKNAKSANADMAPDAVYTTLNRMKKRISELEGRSAKWDTRAKSLQTELDRVKAEYDNLMPEWQRAVADSKNVPRDQMTIPLTQLNGYTFPDVVGALARQALEDRGRLQGKGSTASKAMIALNNVFRGLQASTDVSFMGIQGMILAINDPIAYGRALGAAFKSMADPVAFGKYVRKFDEQAAARGLPDSSQYAANGLHIGGMHSEFEIGTGGIASRIDKALSSDTPLIRLNPVRGSNRSFGAFGDTARLELARLLTEHARSRGIPINDATLAEITRASNLATGWAQNAAGGDVGTLVEFAPRFLQSQLSMLADTGKGIVKGPKATLSEMEARNLMLRFIGTGVMLTVMANEAQGEPLSWREVLDPTYRNGSNFMRIRWHGQDSSLFGPWDSMIKGVIALANGDPGYIARSKASPAVSIAWDMLSGKSFKGEDTHNAEYVLRNILAPFSLSDIGRQSWEETAIGMTGLKTSAMTPNEELDRLSRMEYGKDYFDLLESQQQDMQKKYPDIYQSKLDAQTGQTAQYRDARALMTDRQSKLDDAFLNMAVSRGDWKEQYNVFNDQLAGMGMAIYGDTPITDPKTPKDKYYYIVQQETNPDTQIVDWDAVDDDVKNLTQEEQDWVSDHITVARTPVLQAFRKAQAERREYFQLPRYRGYTGDEAYQIDQLYAKVKANATGKSDGAAIAALGKISREDEVSSKIVAAVRRKITSGLKLAEGRERYAAKHPLMVAFYGGNGKSLDAPLTPKEIEIVRAAIGD